jgi:hypothetical protein
MESRSIGEGKISCAPGTSVLPYSLKMWTIDFTSILHLTPSTLCVFLLLDLKSMVQVLMKHESTDVPGAHDTFPLEKDKHRLDDLVR